MSPATNSKSGNARHPSRYVNAPPRRDRNVVLAERGRRCGAPNWHWPGGGNMYQGNGGAKRKKLNGAVHIVASSSHPAAIIIDITIAANDNDVLAARRRLLQPRLHGARR